MMKRKVRIRSNRGISTIVLVLVIAFFIILPLALLGFEIGRINLVRTELQNVTDAAALAGTAALASSPEGMSYQDVQELAMEVANQTFQQNSILETGFTTANVVCNKNNGTVGTNPPLHSAILNITLLDQNGNVQATGSKTATTIRVNSYFTAKTVFASSILPIMPAATVNAFSDGGLPKLDIILCYDLSGSMDDQTPVNFVRRYWDSANNTVGYQSVGSGKIYDSTLPPNTGTGLNCLRPQNLSYASYPAPSNQHPKIFSEGAFPSPNNIKGLRGNQTSYAPGSLPAPLTAATKYPPGALIPEQGWPPGNFDPTNRSNLNGNGINPSEYANGFTDMIVQVPDKGSFTFPNIQTCVEASRGNLENHDILLQSQGGVKINTTLPAPAAGYYDAYWNQVQAIADPIAASRTAAADFFYIMNVSSNGHFALSTFADQAGTGAGSVWTGTNLNTDSAYTGGGTGTFPVPLIELSKTQSNYDQVLEAINGSATVPPLGPTGKTNIAASLEKAIAELTATSKFRPGAKRAIVLFTDGVPNMPGNDLATASQAAKDQATLAKGHGIPIYTIGLSQNPAIKPAEDDLLGDGKHGSGHGIAFNSGNGAIYISVTTSSQLRQAFQTIARSLVVLQ
jgi:Flp pilus assembly protein TadG